MADTFRFDYGDSIVEAYLTENQRNSIINWQQSYNYTFEFHRGHKTGWPIYIRADGCTLTSNIAKIDTKNLENASWDNIVNPGSLTRYKKVFKTKDIDEIETILSSEWEMLRTIAQGYWDEEGDGEGENIENVTDPVAYRCSNCRQKYTERDGAPGNIRNGKYQCTNCNKWRVFPV